jgi:hypothetical protein
MAVPEEAVSSEPGAATERQKPKPRTRTHVLASIPLLLALLAYNAPTILSEYLAYYGYGEAPSYELPPGVMDAFRTYDLNGDGFLDPYEFVPLGMIVREEEDQFEFQDPELDLHSEALIVMATMEPLLLNTMTKFGDKQEFYFGTPDQILPGLVRWKAPHHPLHIYGVGNFKMFLPPSPSSPLGHTYHIIMPRMDEAGAISALLTRSCQAWYAGRPLTILCTSTEWGTSKCSSLRLPPLHSATPTTSSSLVWMRRECT